MRSLSLANSVEMYCLKGIGLFIVILATLANCQTDDFYSEESDDYDYSGKDLGLQMDGIAVNGLIIV